MYSLLVLQYLSCWYYNIQAAGTTISKLAGTTISNYYLQARLQCCILYVACWYYNIKLLQVLKYFICARFSASTALTWRKQVLSLLALLVQKY